MLDLFDEFKLVVATLEAHAVDYALCGGLAMAVYGVPRATIDIDLLVPPATLDAVIALAEALGYTFAAKPMTFANGAIQIRRISKIAAGDVLMLDLLLVTPEIRSVWDARITVHWEYQTLKVVSRNGLIMLKSLRRSGQDLDDIQRLQEAIDAD